MIKKRSSFFLNSEGFTLIEILVALALIGLLFASLPDIGLNSDRDKLQQTIDLMRRAVRYSGNEAILRNSLVRMRFILDKEPFQFKVEYATQNKLILPKFGEDDSIMRKEELQKEEQSFNKKFSSLPDFTETIGELNEDIRILGISSNLYSSVITNKDSSIYFYPSGERDSALLILFSGEEIATLAIEPYSEKMTEHFEVFQSTADLSTDELEADLKKRSEELYKQWLK